MPFGSSTPLPQADTNPIAPARDVRYGPSSSLAFASNPGGAAAIPSADSMNPSRADGQPNVNTYGQNANAVKTAQDYQREHAQRVFQDYMRTKTDNIVNPVPLPGQPIGPTPGGPPLSGIPSTPASGVTPAASPASAPIPYSGGDGSFSQPGGQDIDPSAPNYHAPGTGPKTGLGSVQGVGRGVLPDSDRWQGANLDKIGGNQGVTRRPNENDAAYQGRIRQTMQDSPELKAALDADPENQKRQARVQNLKEGATTGGSAINYADQKENTSQLTPDEQTRADRVATAKAITDPVKRAAAMRDIARDDAAKANAGTKQDDWQKTYDQKDQQITALQKEKADALASGNEFKKQNQLDKLQQGQQRGTLAAINTIDHEKPQPPNRKDFKHQSDYDDAVDKYNADPKLAAWQKRRDAAWDAHTKAVNGQASPAPTTAAPGPTTQPAGGSTNAAPASGGGASSDKLKVNSETMLKFAHPQLAQSILAHPQKQTATMPDGAKIAWAPGLSDNWMKVA